MKKMLFLDICIKIVFYLNIYTYVCLNGVISIISYGFLKDKNIYHKLFNI